MLVVSLVILILWEMPFMKKISIFKIIQGPLVVVLTGIGLGHFFKGDEAYALGESTFVNLEVLDSLGDIGTLFTFPDFSAFGNTQVYVIAVTIAIVASLETLLCVEATDKLDPHKRVTPTNRELVAQGAGNMLSGFIGGLPIPQVIVRSSANIQSGGQTKLSAILHGVLLLACVLFIPEYLNMVPLASLAAILFVVGFKLAKPALFVDMASKGMQMFLPFIVKIVMIVATDLLVGIGVGLAVAILFLLYNNLLNPFTKSEEKGSVIIELAENVSFVNRAKIQVTLEGISDDTNVIIDGSNSKSVHSDVLEVIREFKDNSSERKGSVEINGLRI